MKQILTILLLSLIGFTACRHHTAYPLAIQQAEQLMSTRPDSALTLLQGMADTLATLPEETRMYHQLLTIQAKDKQYITHTSDSLINRIVSFYEDYGNSDRLMMAYFYQGSTYRDMNDTPRALKAFHQAIDAGKKTKNLILLGQAYGQMGTLFSYQELYDEALEAKRKALQLYSIQKDSTRFPYLNRDIARIFNAKGEKDSALVYYHKALGLGFRNTYQNTNILSEMGCLYYYKDETEKAKSILENVLSLNPKTSNALLFLGLIHKGTGQLDSAFYYVSKATLYGDINNRRSAYKVLTLIEKERGNINHADLYHKKYTELQDSIILLNRAETIRKYHQLYHFQHLEKERDYFKLKNQQKQSLLNYLFLGFLLCLVSLLFLSFSYSKRKKEIENQRLRLNEILKEREKSAWAKQKTDERQIKKKDIMESEIYILFRKMVQENINPTEENWEQLKEFLDKTYPNITFRICMLYPKITQHHLKICYLTKLKFSNDNMAKLLHLTPASISITRKRLYEKMTGISGKPENFNSLIADL